MFTVREIMEPVMWDRQYERDCLDCISCADAVEALEDIKAHLSSDGVKEADDAILRVKEHMRLYPKEGDDMPLDTWTLEIGYRELAVALKTLPLNEQKAAFDRAIAYAKVVGNEQ